MNALTPAQRKAAQRKRDKDDGFTELLVKVRSERVEEMREFELRLQKKKRLKNP